MSEMKTRWDWLQNKLAEARYEVARLEKEIKYLKETPFTANGTGACSKCGEPLPTEADFAKHFTVPDFRYPNLGYCPKFPRDGAFRRRPAAPHSGCNWPGCTECFPSQLRK
jgi:hypothetical protein